MGRDPITLDSKILRGTFRPDRLKKNQSQAITGPVKMPPNLPKEAKKLWKTLAPQLQEAGLLTPMDVNSFALLCCSWSVALEAAQKLEEEGLTRLDENKVNRKSIYLQILRESTVTFKALASEFGLTPSARAKLTLPALEKETLSDKLRKAVNE